MRYFSNSFIKLNSGTLVFDYEKTTEERKSYSGKQNSLKQLFTPSGVKTNQLCRVLLAFMAGEAEHYFMF